MKQRGHYRIAPLALGALLALVFFGVFYIVVEATPLIRSRVQAAAALVVVLGYFLWRVTDMLQGKIYRWEERLLEHGGPKMALLMSIAYLYVVSEPNHSHGRRLVGDVLRLIHDAVGVEGEWALGWLACAVSLTWLVWRMIQTRRGGGAYGESG